MFTPVRTLACSVFQMQKPREICFSIQDRAIVRRLVVGRSEHGGKFELGSRLALVDGVNTTSAD